MGILGIKWQHSYEPGSGGKGGVGNSGRIISGIKPSKRSNRTAGQILLLLIGKRCGNIIGHRVTGAAIHKELKALIGQKDVRQRQRLTRHNLVAKVGTTVETFAETNLSIKNITQRKGGHVFTCYLEADARRELVGTPGHAISLSIKMPGARKESPGPPPKGSSKSCHFCRICCCQSHPQQ
jgi:hypothetical protein